MCAKSLPYVDLFDAPGVQLAYIVVGLLVEDADVPPVSDPPLSLDRARLGALHFDLDFASAFLAKKLDNFELGGFGDDMGELLAGLLRLPIAVL